jgi:hypothetical protein
LVSRAAAHGHVGEGPAGGFGDDDPAPAAAMLPPAPLPVAVSLAGELRRQRRDSPALSSVSPDPGPPLLLQAN